MVRLRWRGGLITNNASLLRSLRTQRAGRRRSLRRCIGWRRRTILLLRVDLGSSGRRLVRRWHVLVVQRRGLLVGLHRIAVLSGSVVLLLAVILVVDNALHLRFEARALVPRDEPLVVGQRSEALLHPALCVNVASDKPQQEYQHEHAENDIFDDDALLREPEGVVVEVVVGLEGWVT